MKYLLSLKKKIKEFFERSERRKRILFWRNKTTNLLLFLDNYFPEVATTLLVCVIVFISIYSFSWRAPRPFPEHTLITIEQGETLSEIASSFRENGVVRSSFWLKTLIVLRGGEKKVIAGDYYFPEAKSIFGVIGMLTEGKFGLVPIKVTIPEGLSSREIATLLKDYLPGFDDKSFLDEVDKTGMEGYLFPDTYFFLPNATPGNIIMTMRENFARQIKPYEGDMAKFGKPLEEIVIMASLIEDESNHNLASKRIVAGILWKRIKLDMLLQVDAPFQYYNGKHSGTLTKADLAEDHPYNTYVNKGLPPTAITNPGIDSLRAAIAPTNTEYLYFLSDRSGNMYYAKNFEDHKRNREAHLN